MEANTGYIITKENAQLVANITGKERKIIDANIGLVAWFQDYPAIRWVLVPKNIADKNPDFHYVDSPLNGLPSRTVKEIRQEWAVVNKEYSEKLDSLRKELERAKLKEGGEYGSETET